MTDKPDFVALAEIFISRRDAFRISHKEDYKSPASRAAYDEQEDAYEDLMDAIGDLVRDYPDTLLDVLKQAATARSPSDPAA